jgi:hypothetical protein
MAYGDTGLGGGQGMFKEKMPWTEPEILAPVAGQPPFTKTLRFLLDTGATANVVPDSEIKNQNIQLTFLGGRKVVGIGGETIVVMFKGMSFKFHAFNAQNQPVDLTLANDVPFAVTAVDKEPGPPPILGGFQFVGTETALTVNYKTNTVKIATG